MRRVALVLALSGVATLMAQSPAPVVDPLPQTVEEFQATARRVLQETGVPGAGIALVRNDGVEWEGGVGFADRDAQSPVTADTHFRVGSISKTFVALALVQLYEDGDIDLDAPVRDLAPEIAIDNPWEKTHPVRLIHLLQHTAGFDDMHFNEMQPRPGARELSLEEVLRLNPASRRVRWQPGTRMAYSNPGYTVAGYLLESIAGQPYENYIEQEIFEPLEMTTSSFNLTDDDVPLMAQGYVDRSGPPVGFQPIYHRPSGSMHSSPRELARFVRMLLGWGELGTAFVVDPEYLGSMEQPRTTDAAKAGLRHGYGTGISIRLDLPFHVLGHDGGIRGFLSTFGYSPARDVGYVVLLNSTGGGAVDAMRRLSSLAIRYLKRDVEPPRQAEVPLDAAIADRYVGFYREANPRSQFFWPLRALTTGWHVVREGDHLYIKPLFGNRVRLAAVSDSTFRLDNEIGASRVFTINAERAMVMAGGWLYAERVDRWRVEVVRLPVAAAIVVVGSVVIPALVWIVRIRRPPHWWTLKAALLLCPVALFVPFIVLRHSGADLGARNVATQTIFLGTLALPALALVVAFLTIAAKRRRASRWITTYAALVALALATVSIYLSSSDMLPIRTWTY